MTKQLCILVADDDENDISMIVAALSRERPAGSVEVVRDGAEALDFLNLRDGFKDRQPGNPDVMLLDLNMPRIDGWEVLRQIRSNSALKLIPVVIFSSSARDRDVAQSYELGANAYVVKPIDYEEFVRAVGCIEQFWVGCNKPPHPPSFTILRPRPAAPAKPVRRKKTSP